MKWQIQSPGLSSDKSNNSVVESIAYGADGAGTFLVKQESQESAATMHKKYEDKHEDKHGDKPAKVTWLPRLSTFLVDQGRGLQKVVSVRSYELNQFAGETERQVKVQWRHPEVLYAEQFEATLTPFVPGVQKQPGSEAAAAKTIRSPMAGKVFKVLCQNGSEVSKDTPLLIIEAMKMENKIFAASLKDKAKVERLLVKEGDQVAVGQVLVKLV